MKHKNTVQREILEMDRQFMGKTHELLTFREIGKDSKNIEWKD